MNVFKLIFTLIDVILLISTIYLDCGETISDSERKSYRIAFIIFTGNIISIWSKQKIS